MRVKIVAHFSDDNGNFTHADLIKPLYVEVRDHIAENWAKNGWCILLPTTEPVEEKLEAKAVIETPEDQIEAEGRETAALRRRNRPRS